MKVAINIQIGGFSLSNAAVIRLYELGSPYIEAVEPKEYYGDTWEKELEERGPDSPSYDLLYNNKILSYIDYRHANRSCSVLIQVVDELGEDAGGSRSSIKVVEIPDDVEYIIMDCEDGREYIAEKHRTWE